MTQAFNYPFNFPFLAMYEGEGGESGSSDNNPPANPDPGYKQPITKGRGQDGLFTQDDVNQIMADHKRHLQEQVQTSQQRYEELETSYQQLLTNQNLTNDERSNLKTQLDDLRKQFRTKEQLLADEKREAEESAKNQIENLTSERDRWKTEFTEQTIQNALLAAANSNDAFNHQQIVTLLRGQTKLVEDVDAKGNPVGKFKPMVEMTVLNEETKQHEVLQMTPDEAVAHMKKTEVHGNLFKNNIKEGIGSTSATGATSGNGTVAHDKLTDEQWFKLRQENPAALGLKGPSGRWD